MATFSSEFFRQKLTKKNLLVELEDNEDVFASIKLAMKNHNIDEVSVELMEGTMKSGKMSVIDRSQFKMLSFNNSEIVNARGHFKLNYDTLFGSINVLAKIGKPETGKLEKGNAANGLKIKLAFYE